MHTLHVIPYRSLGEGWRVRPSQGVYLSKSVPRDTHQGLECLRVLTDKDTVEQVELCFVVHPAVPFSPQM